MKTGWRALTSWAVAGLMALSYSLFMKDQVSALSEGERLDRQLPLRSGGRLTLENTRGDIHISSWSEERVELKVEKSGSSDEDLELVPVEINAGGDAVHVSSLFPVYAPDLQVRVDYHLRVPETVDLKLIKTVNGEVRVVGVKGRAVIEVDNGKVTVSGFAGYLKAQTVNGEIEADITRVARDDFVSLESYNGDLRLRLPKDVRAHWVVRTLNGRIDSVVRFAVLDDFGPHVAHLDAAKGPMIRAYSVNGDIHVDER